MSLLDVVKSEGKKFVRRIRDKPRVKMDAIEGVLVNSEFVNSKSHRFHKEAVIEQTGNINTTVASQTVRFTIDEENAMSQIELSHFRYNLIETSTTSSATPVAVADQIDKVDLFLSSIGNTTPVQTIPGDALKASMQFFDDDYIEESNFGNVMNINLKDMKTPSAVPAGATRPFVLHLHGLVLNQFMPKVVAGTITIAITFKSSIISSGSGTLTLDSPRLVIHYDDDIYATERLIQEHKMSPSHYAYLNPVCNNFTFTLSATGAASEIVLAGFTQNVAMLALMFRSSVSVTSNAVGTYLPLGGVGTVDTPQTENLATIELKDTNNQSYSAVPLNCRDLRGLIMGSHFPGNFSRKQAVYYMTFSENPVGSFVRGEHHGQLKLTGTQKLVVTPRSGITGGSTILTVIAYDYRMLGMNTKGIMEILE